jgi:hypothetical protein
MYNIVDSEKQEIPSTLLNMGREDKINWHKVCI